MYVDHGIRVYPRDGKVHDSVTYCLPELAKAQCEAMWLAADHGAHLWLS